MNRFVLWHLQTYVAEITPTPKAEAWNKIAAILYTRMLKDVLQTFTKVVVSEGLEKAKCVRGICANLLRHYLSRHPCSLADELGIDLQQTWDDCGHDLSSIRNLLKLAASEIVDDLYAWRVCTAAVDHLRQSKTFPVAVFVDRLKHPQGVVSQKLLKQETAYRLNGIVRGQNARLCIPLVVDSENALQFVEDRVPTADWWSFVAGAMQYYDRKKIKNMLDMMRPYTDAFTTRRAKALAPQIHFFSNPDRQEYCQQQFTHAHFLAAQAEFSSLFRHKFMSGKHNFFKSIPYICSEQHYGTLKRCLANEIVFKQQPSLFNAWCFFPRTWSVRFYMLQKGQIVTHRQKRFEPTLSLMLSDKTTDKRFSDSPYYICIVFIVTGIFTQKMTVNSVQLFYAKHTAADKGIKQCLKVHARSLKLAKQKELQQKRKLVLTAFESRVQKQPRRMRNIYDDTCNEDGFAESHVPTKNTFLQSDQNEDDLALLDI